MRTRARGAHHQRCRRDIGPGWTRGERDTRLARELHGHTQVVSLEGKRLLSLEQGLTPLSSFSAVLGLQRGNGQSGARTAQILSGEGRQVAPIVDELGEEREVTARAVLKSVLEQAHYDVSTAQDGEQAFTLLQQRPFDLVLSDVQMPHKDGFSLTESIH